MNENNSFNVNIEEKVIKLVQDKSTLIEEILTKFDSPYYLYFYDILMLKLNLFRKFIDKIKIKNKKLYYACKANSNPNLVKIMKKNGIEGLDCVSPGEVFLAEKLKFLPENILYTSNNNTNKELKAIYDKGILINFNDLDAMENFLIEYKLENIEVCIRVNQGTGLGANEYIITSGKISKFGVKIEEFPRLINIIKTHKVKLVGIHQHSGSNIKDNGEYISMLDRFLSQVDCLFNLLEKAELDNCVKLINFGGGFGIKYSCFDKQMQMDDLANELNVLFEKYDNVMINKANNIQIIFEPGRYIIAESGVLVCSLTSKRYLTEKDLFLGINTGLNHLIRPALYKSFHNIYDLSTGFNFSENMNKVNINKDINVSLYGNICESSDYFIKNETFEFDSLNLYLNDIILIFNVGAYGYSMASMYNSRDIPCEILIKENNFFLIRNRINIEQFDNVDVINFL